MKNSVFIKRFRELQSVLRHPRVVYAHFAGKKIRKQTDLSDEEYLKKMFKARMGYELNLENPRTFNEKLNWLKLYNRDPRYSAMVDKHAVKKFVSDSIGEVYVARELGYYESFDQIDFDLLPPQFVLKTTHGSGGICICRDRSSFDFKSARAKLQSGLSENYYLQCREWPYKNVPPRIIAEEFLSDGTNDALPVFKFFCFDGEPFLAQVIQNDKCSDETIDYVDMNYALINVRQNYPNSKKMLDKPGCFEEMKEICRRLSKGIPFVRCDLYAIGNRVLFSEFTFYSDAGFEPFYPKKWDFVLGDLLRLPEYKIS